MTAKRGKILVIGLGNPILGDDGVGWHIAMAAQTACEGCSQADSVNFELSSAGGLGLMEQMVGYQRAIIADSIVTSASEIGAIRSKPFSEYLATAHSSSSHDATLQAALEIGRRMGLLLPTELWAITIEIAPSYVFSETLSPAVASAVPGAADLIRTRLAELSNPD
ncbi:MAG: hydrogenase maturation protease [Anaerolineales bacterium]